MSRKQKHDGVLTQPYKVEELRSGVVEYRKIQAFQACNYDGENAGWEQGTRDGDRYLIEKRFIPTDKDEKITFTNCW
jgi:hypothetical protein